MIQVTGILIDPLGRPIPDAEIRVTALETNVVTKSSTATYTTLADGSYDFTLEYGTYDLEVNISCEYVLSGVIIVDEATPNPIRVEDLVNYSPVVTPPVIIPEDPTWEDLHDDLRTDVDSEERTKVDQIGDTENTVNETKVIVTNERLDASIAEYNEIIEAADVKAERQVSLYQDSNLNQSIQDNLVGNTSNGSLTVSNEVYQASNGNVDIHSAKELVSNRGSIKHHVDIKESSGSLTEEELVDGCGFQTNVTVDVPSDGVGTLSVEQDVLFERTDVIIKGRRYEDMSTEHLNDDFTLIQKPKGIVGTETSLESGTNTGSIFDSQEILIDESDVPQAKQERGITALLKSAWQRITNNGTSTKMLTQVDNYCIQDDAGNTIVDFDTVNKVMNVNAQLIVANPDDFKGPKGDENYLEFQYSENNGVPDWHDEYVDGVDIWRRHRQITVIDGVRTEYPWSAGYLLTAEDGLPGDTLYFRYEYSVDGLTNWHDTLTDGDLWRREYLVTNGVDGPVSVPAKIAGADGDDGEIVFEEYLYSTDGLGVPPPTDTDPSNGWHPNFSTGDHYRTTRVIKYAPGTPIPIDPSEVPIEVTDWTPAALLTPRKGFEYFDGQHGSGSYVIEVPLASKPISDADIENLFRSELGFDSSEFDIVTFQGDSSVSDADQFADSYIRNGTDWDGSNDIWEEFALVVDGNAIIHGTVAAEALVAKTITGDKINSETTIIAGSGATTAGMNGDDSGTDTTNRYRNIRFWAGSEYPRDGSGILSAPFLVEYDGTIQVGQVAGYTTKINGKVSNIANPLVEITKGTETRLGIYGSGRLKINNATNTDFLIDIDPETDSSIFKGTIYAYNLVGDVFKTVLWDIQTYNAHTAYRGTPIEVEKLSFTVESVPGLGRHLVIPPMKCDTQTIRVYEDNVKVAEVDTFDDPDPSGDELTPQIIIPMRSDKVLGESVTYSIRTYDYINPGSIITSKRVVIFNGQVIQMVLGKSQLIVT